MTPATTTATPRAEKWLYQRLVPAVTPLTVHRSFSSKTARHVRYSWQGQTNLVQIAGNRFVSTAWLVYVAQSPASGTPLWAEDLKLDADKIDEALHFPPIVTVDGMSVDGAENVGEHYFEVWQNNVLAELQLGAMYRVYTSVVVPP